MFGCKQSVDYSEKYKDIPIYPGVELTSYSTDQEIYEMMNFDESIQDVNDFYLNHIDQSKWTVKESFLFWTEENTPERIRRYILTDDSREILLTLSVEKSYDNLESLLIKINGTSFKEGVIRAEGESVHWKAMIEYLISKDIVLINGQVEFKGKDSPITADIEFLEYEISINPIPSSGLVRKSLTEKTSGQLLEDSKIIISNHIDRDYSLEDTIEGINNAYIDMTWEEDGIEIHEKIEISVAH